MSKVRFTLNILAVAIFTLTVASMAQAQATRTWVSGVGDDANPCSRTAPCKTFAGAISKTATNGEISVLDPGGFGGLTITKGITVNGEGTLAGVLNSLVNGFVVNAPTDAHVNIRNVFFNGVGNGLNGIRVLSAKNVIIENVTINGVTGIGIDVFAGANVNVLVNNTQVKNCTGSALRAETSAGIARVTVKNSTFSSSGTGIKAGRNSRVAAYESTISFNTIGLHAEGISGTTVAFLKSCHVNNNTSHGIQAGSASATSTSTVRITDNLINNNAGAGVNISTNGAVESFQNNEISGNNPDGCAGCANITGALN